MRLSCSAASIVPDQRKRWRGLIGNRPPADMAGAPEENSSRKALCAQARPFRGAFAGH